MPPPSGAVRPLPDDLAEKVGLAAEVFAEYGLDATRVDEVARVTGIPRATLYYYFPGKVHILAHLLSSTLADLTAQLESAAAGAGSGRERLERVIREHFGFIASHGSTYRLLFAELGKAASLVDVATGVDTAILAPLRTALRAGEEDGSLRVVDVPAAASVVYGAVLVAGMEYLLVAGDRGLDRRVTSMLQVVFEGLAPRPDDTEVGVSGDDNRSGS